MVVMPVQHIKMTLSSNAGDIQWNHLGDPQYRCSKVRCLTLAFHRQQTATCSQQMLAGTGNICQVRKRSADNLSVETFMSFDPGLHNRHIGEAKLNLHLLQKAGFFAVAVQQHKPDLRIVQCQRDTRQTRTTANVKYLA